MSVKTWFLLQQDLATAHSSISADFSYLDNFRCLQDHFSEYDFCVELELAVNAASIMT